MVNRVRLVKVHVCVLGTIRKLTPMWFGKTRSREQILNDLELIMDNVRVEYDLSKGDMPDPQEFKACLSNFPDFSVFPSIDRDLIARLDSLIEKEIPDIVNDADIAAREVKLESKEEETSKAETEATDEDEPTLNHQNVNDNNIGGMLGKLILICLLFLTAVEGIHYYSFSKPALSVDELYDGFAVLYDGYQKAAESPALSRIHSNVSPRTAQPQPLSSLPTLSGVTSGVPTSKSSSPSSERDEL